MRRLLGVQLLSQVDEVFQDTWMRIITARASFVPQGAAWRTWAFTIAHNLAMDRLREIGREVSYYAHDEDGDGLDAARLFDRGVLRRDVATSSAQPSTEDIAFWQAAGRRLLACLDELPADQRAAFLLHHEDGFTVDALAAALDVGFETVRSRLRYALKKLRGCMERYLTALGQVP